METFAEPKKLIRNPRYRRQKEKSLRSLTNTVIEAPLVDLINGFNKLPYCFTLQCCYGHFVYDGQEDIHNLEPLPLTESPTEVTYRIAYICFCIEKSTSGEKFLEDLKKVPAIDPHNIQICSAEWFWKRQVNSYALQVEPERYKEQDTAILDFKEAFQIEKIRNEFFIRLKKVLVNQERKNLSTNFTNYIRSN